jgi:hypothetical protein
VAPAWYDKGRAAGGRVATRRRHEWQWDHGAQFFTVRDPRFAAALRPLQESGLVQRWFGPFRTLDSGNIGADPRPGTERWVGVPGMSALPRALADGIQPAVEARVDALHRGPDGFTLHVAAAGATTLAAHGPFAAVVLAVPSAQAHALLAAAGIDGPVTTAAAVRVNALQPCLAALVACERPAEGIEGGWFVTDDELAWAAHDGGKPGRNGAATYVLHAAADWSARHLDRDPSANAQALVASFARCLGRSLPPVVHLEAHRWRYATAAAADADAPLAVVDAAQGLVLCGDGLVGGRVEGAWCSGIAAAERLLAELA